MTIQLRDAIIHIRHPGTQLSDPPDIYIPRGDIIDFGMTERIDAQKAAGNARLNNDDGQYTLDDDGSVLPVEDRIHTGDRLDFWVSFAEGGSPYGGGAYGGAGYGSYRLRNVGLVRDVDYRYRSPSISSIDITLEDYPFGILSKREVSNSWENVRVSGTSLSLVDRLLANHAPELDTDGVKPITETISLTADRMNLFDLLKNVARRVGATMYSMGDDLMFEQNADIGVIPSSVLNEFDWGPHTYREDDIGLVNSLRVDGAASQAIDATNPTDLNTSPSGTYYEADGVTPYAPDSYTTISNSTQVMFRVGTRKATIDRIELWTRTTGSGESYVVRVQKDDGTGTAPVNADDSSSDIVSRQLGTDDELFLDDDGFTTFLLPDHTLPEPRPWVIVETDGDVGQDIGIEADDGNPAYVNWYPYSLSVQQSNPTSQQVYRRRDGTIRRKNIQSLEEAQELGNETIDHDSVPMRVWQAPAESLAAHEVRPGDGFELSYPREAVDGEWVCIERETVYDTDTGLDTIVSAQRLSDYKSQSEK